MAYKLLIIKVFKFICRGYHSLNRLLSQAPASKVSIKAIDPGPGTGATTA